MYITYYYTYMTTTGNKWEQKYSLFQLWKNKHGDKWPKQVREERLPRDKNGNPRPRTDLETEENVFQTTSNSSKR